MGLSLGVNFAHEKALKLNLSAPFALEPQPRDLRSKHKACGG